MFKLGRFLKYIARILLKVSPLALLLLFSGFVTTVLAYLVGIQLKPLPILLSAGLFLASLSIVWQVAARFVHSLYGLEDEAQARKFLKCQLFGRPDFSPYLIIRKGKITAGHEIVKRVGGPAGLFVYNDSAVVLEQAGRLSRVIRGPAFSSLEPFEKVWDIIDLRPQRWVFKVSAITQDGIPIDYDADIRFQVDNTDEGVFKAATSKWIRDAWRTEPDRLMDWTKLVIISQTEGTMRSILARYTLDELIDPSCRQTIRAELEESLAKSTLRRGVKIVSVALGDVKLKGQVVQQWIEAWRAEKEREMRQTIVEGQAERARMLQKARLEIRKRMLEKTAQVFTRMAGNGQKASSELVILSFIEMLRHVSSEQRLYLQAEMADNIVGTLQQKIGVGSLSGQPDSVTPGISALGANRQTACPIPLAVSTANTEAAQKG